MGVMIEFEATATLTYGYVDGAVGMRSQPSDGTFRHARRYPLSLRDLFRPIRDPPCTSRGSRPGARRGVRVAAGNRVGRRGVLRRREGAPGGRAGKAFRARR